MQIDAAINLAVHTFVIPLFYISFILTSNVSNKQRVPPVI
ncbi:putative membrane protein [Vibrio paracholerae HE-09]|nr:putative membrane protein [Vibrio paracholerae HE-09]